MAKLTPPPKKILLRDILPQYYCGYYIPFNVRTVVTSVIIFISSTNISKWRHKSVKLVDIRVQYGKCQTQHRQNRNRTLLNIWIHNKVLILFNNTDFKSKVKIWVNLFRSKLGQIQSVFFSWRSDPDQLHLYRNPGNSTLPP